MTDDRCALLCLDLPAAERLRRDRLGADRLSRLTGKARAFGDPTRLMLAAALAEADELCVCDLSWIAERATHLVSHHLRALHAEGLVRSRCDGKLVLYYRLTDEGRRLLAALLAEPAVP